MSKKIRQLVTLLVVVVLIGAMTVVLTLLPSEGGDNTSSDAGSSSSGSAETEYLYQHEETDVKAFTLKNANGTFSFTGWYNEDQKRMNYQIIGYEGIDFLDSMPGKVAAYAEEMEIVRWIGEKEDLSEYGLTEKEAVRLQATYADGSTRDILIGGTLNSNEEQRYAVENGSNKVFVVEADELLDISAKTLLPSLLLSIQAVDAEENLMAPEFNLIRISGRGHKNPLEIHPVEKLEGIDLSSPLANATYYIQENVMHPVLPEATSTFLCDMCLIQSKDVVAIKPTAAQRAEYGMDDPIVLEVEVIASRDDDGKPKQIDEYKVYVGKIDTAKGVAYAMVPERDVIYEIDANCVKALTMTAFEMREKVMYMLAGNSIKDMVITANGKVYPFLRERTKIESVNSTTGETMVEYEYEAYYNNELMVDYPLLYSQFLAAFTEGPITESTQKGELILQADLTHFEEMSKKTTKICIYACEDERRVLYEVDGELLGYTRKTWATKVCSDVEALIQGKKLTVTY